MLFYYIVQFKIHTKYKKYYKKDIQNNEFKISAPTWND